MTSTFSGAVRAAFRISTLRQRAILAAMAAGSALVVTSLIAESFPIGFLGAMLAVGALTCVKP